MIKRRKTKKVKVKNIYIGGDSPVSVQTMTNTDTSDVRSTVAQIKKLEKAGADIIRVSVPDEKAAEALKQIVKKAKVPIVADIHFNYRLAVLSVLNGAHKIRINPGTIGPESKVKEIIRICKEYQVPIRIGLNAASLPKYFRQKNHEIALIEAAKYWVSFFEDEGFFDIVISAKSSSVLETIKVYEELSSQFNYPLHIGVTEAGTLFSGSIRSSAALSILLYQGIGDTLRISLSGNPYYEVKAGIELLVALGLRRGPMVIACPTCARTRINVEKLAVKLEKKLSSIKIPLKIAVMGCEVNGPGEARDADLGIAGTKRGIMLFSGGKSLGVFSEEDAFKKLLEIIEEKFIKEGR